MTMTEPFPPGATVEAARAIRTLTVDGSGRGPVPAGRRGHVEGSYSGYIHVDFGPPWGVVMAEEDELRPERPAAVAAFARLPRTVELGGESVTLRLFGPDDTDLLLAFFRGLPRADLSFLQQDLTAAAAITDWITEVTMGRTITVLAQVGEQIIGEASLQRSQVPWTDHVAQARVTTAASYRGRGLGGVLLHEVFDLAEATGVEKIVAEMTVEQEGARRLFEKLGFTEEGRYKAYVKDIEGQPHDLIVMTHTSAALSGRAGG